MKRNNDGTDPHIVGLRNRAEIKVMIGKIAVGRCMHRTFNQPSHFFMEINERNIVDQFQSC